ncbi:Glycosyl transferase protein [Pseudomonas cannabina]|uniref:Glycosyl transferase family protein n=1 Tax=Pseudomonas cannabina TaxID=86840 RepID=A0A0P9L8G9_PSECA|nr:Glycosyl transferase family protein [Pseudomonas cannabina]RMN20239.1 Glycosyl transferase protein [Pseudomonas cannabina]
MLLTLASSKRVVYLMSLAPAAAVIAAEYAFVLGEKLRAQSAFPGVITKNRRVLSAAGVSLIVICYLSAALWLVPRADSQYSFVPLTDKTRALQVQGRHVALFRPTERLAGASVFYGQSVLDALMSSADLNTYLDRSVDNVAILENLSAAAPPLRVVDQVKVGERTYYFVSR